MQVRGQLDTDSIHRPSADNICAHVNVERRRQEQRRFDMEQGLIYLWLPVHPPLVEEIPYEG